MSSVFLLLAVVVVAGLSATRWAARMAPLWSEFPAKTLCATVLAGLAAAGEYGAVQMPGWFIAVATVVGPIYVFGPLLLVYLVRNGGWRPATVFLKLLYWTQEGRSALGRLLAQAALQEGDPEAALALSPVRDALLMTQAHLLEGDWEAVLGVEEARSGGGADNAHLVAAARIEALLELGRPEEARREFELLQGRFAAGAQGPLGHRAVVLSEARLKAYEGDLNGVQALLAQPLVGVRPETLYRVLGAAAERAGRRDAATRAYLAAFANGKGRLRERARRDLQRLGVEPTETVQRRRHSYATYALIVVLAAAYAAQVGFDRSYGLVRALGTLFQPSNVVAAFLQGLPALPAADAWWRYLSYAFLHGNFIHLAFNLWVLYDIGRHYELRRSWGDMLAAFTLGTAAGAWLTTLFQAGQQLVLVGASGGILGVAGALLAEALLGRSQADRMLLKSLVQWMAILLLFSVAVPGVSLWGHVGGVAGGFVYGLLRLRLPLGQRFAQAAGVLSVGLLALSVYASLTTVLPLLP
ncbi:MAG: rhomboid family intramembrane serine protease [Trueperaceae bacterium]